MCRKLARFQRSDRGVQRCSTFMAFEAHVERAERSAKRHDRSSNVTRRCGPVCTILLPESRCLLLLVPLPLLLICYLCAYLPHDDPSRAALMNRFYSHGADSKNKKVRKTRTASKAGTFVRTLDQLKPSHQRGRKPYRPPSCVRITRVSPASTGAAVMALPSVLARPTNSPFAVERKCTKPW
jgi:hypothetical protein